MRQIGRALLAVALATAALSAQAAGHKADRTAAERKAAAPTSPITDRFAVRIGGWNTTVSTRARIDQSGVLNSGTEFVAERDFGLSDRSRQFRGEAVFRLRERMRVRFSGMSLTRTGSKLLSQNYVFGNQTLLAGERMESRHELSTMDFTLLYSMLKRDRIEIGLGLGMHLFQTELSGAIPNRPTGAVFERFSGSGPYPDLAGDVTWRMTRRFAVCARAQVLQVQASGIKANIGDYHTDVQFRMKPYLAAGLGYQFYSMDVNAPNEDPGGHVRMEYKGPELFLRASL